MQQRALGKSSELVLDYVRKLKSLTPVCHPHMPPLHVADVLSREARLGRVLNRQQLQDHMLTVFHTVRLTHGVLQYGNSGYQTPDEVLT